MPSLKTPTPDAVERATARLVRPQQQRYFFERLNNPLWIGPLRERKWFSRPPQTVQGADSEFHPQWPALHYLRRMASLPEAQEAVLAVILELPKDITNVTVQESVVAIAVALPPEMAVQAVPQILAWPPPRTASLLPKTLGELLARLASGGQAKPGLKIAELLLRLAEAPAEERAWRRPKPRIGEWHLRLVLEERYPSLVRALPAESVRLLRTSLESALQATSVRQDTLEDYSTVWRPQIESSRHEDTLNLLTTALLAALRQVARERPDRIEVVLADLRHSKQSIFRRLELTLAADLVGSHPTLAVALLPDRQAFDRCLPEYATLLGAGFGVLPPEGQARILEWTAGPERPLRHPEALPAWRRARLEPIAGHLGAGLAAELDELRRNVPDAWIGEPAAPTVWVGPTSPLGPHELKSLPPERVSEALASWVVPAGDRQPSPEGLGRVLAEVVEEATDAYSAVALTFRGLDPTYVRHFLAGLTRGVRAGRRLEWNGVVGLCEWVLEQPGNGRTVDDADPHWGWTRTDIARLLESGLTRSSSGLGASLADRVWALLAKLAEDPEPTTEYEAEFGGSNMDPGTLSINTTRGEALHAVIGFALWRRQPLREGRAEPVTLADMPEVRDVLDRHLDPAIDPSLAIRSVYGRWLPWLFDLDPAWLESRLPTIFPTDPDAKHFWDAAWVEFVIRCGPYGKLLPLLEPSYVRAIQEVGRHVDEASALSEPARHLVDHLVVYTRAGHGTHLLAQVLNSAPRPVRAYALRFIGLVGEDSPRWDEDAVQRFADIWEQRVARAESVDPPERSEAAAELASFGWSFASGQFDPEWTLRIADRIVALGVRLEADHKVARRLVVLASAHLERCLPILGHLIRSDVEGWSLIGWDSEARQLLSAGLASEVATVREAATELIHELGGRGFFDFGELLKGGRA